MFTVHTYDCVPSTNTIAKDLACKNAPHGTSVIAKNQTDGRGRLGKEWHSEPGKGLFCSIIVRPALTAQDYPKITLAAGLAVSVTLDRLTTTVSQLKWPNDIYFSGKKCGGILTESSVLAGQEEDLYAVVGIGINVNNTLQDFPFELKNQVSSLFLETGITFTIFDVFEAVRSELLATLELFSNEGFGQILRAWKRKDFLYGKKMKCVTEKKTILEGIAMGPDEEGQLHVRDSEGRLHSVLSGDVRLAK